MLPEVMVRFHAMARSAPTVVYLIRHGQTAWNVEEVFRGRADVALDERGQSQAQALARALASEHISAVYSSPLKRAALTARPIAEVHGLEAQVDERLTDLNFGAWEGKTLSEVRRTSPDLFAQWERDPGAVTFPGGESLALVRARAAAAVEELIQRHCGETVAIVSHRVVTKVLLCHVLGLDDSHFWQIRQDTACINRLERTAREWVVITMNDVCHLRDAAATAGRDF
jgi:alpha-ribazole phosphatase